MSMNMYNRDLISDVVEKRSAADYSLTRLRLCSTQSLRSILRHYDRLSTEVALEIFSQYDPWPGADPGNSDPVDYLFI